MRISMFAAAALGIAACGGAAGDYGSGDDDSSGANDASSGTPQCFSSSECPVGWTCSELGFCEPPPSGDAGAPPEVEYEFGSPVSSRRYVWVAMKQQEEVAKIDGNNLAVSAIAVGDRPEELVALPGTDTAVILATDAAAATVVRPTSENDITEVEPTLPDLNELSASPSGRHAVAWFSLVKAVAEAGSLDAVGDVQSMQDVTVLGLDPGASHTVDLTVGFRPREVEFDAAGTHAYVITDDGISVIDLDEVLSGGPHIIPPIPVTPDPFADTSGLEVDVTSAGDLAVVREAGGAWVRVVGLAGATTGQMWDLPLPAAPTDLEMSPDGLRAYAVLRDTSQLAVIDLPDIVQLVDLPTATMGSMTLSKDGRRAALYTNATLDERITFVQLDQPGFPSTTFPLQKSVRAVAFDPTGDKLLVLHARAPGDPSDATTTEEYIDRRWGYSIVDVATGFPKLQLTPVDPGAFTFDPTGTRAYLCLDGGDDEGATAELQEIELDTGVVRSHDLGSPPEDVGILPDGGKVFVSQRHPLGRVTFFDVTTGDEQTLTGFDLNSHVIDN
jgi:DNA-binding beta-propeller fold protein YncE